MTISFAEKGCIAWASRRHADDSSDDPKINQ
uniref:Uncharacterized protein n=1 Tax=Anguilla anguilla TaxID=7936 RepID=A0A0E9RYZ4_ANGAN